MKLGLGSQKVATAATAVIVAMFAALLVLLCLWLYESYSSSVRRTQERAIAASKIVATNVTWINALAWQALQKIDGALGPDIGIATETVKDIDATISDLPGTVQAYVVDRNGNTLLSTDPAIKPMNITDREYFLALAKGASTYVSSLLVSRLNGQQIFVFSRRLERNGQFAGAAMVSFQGDLLEEVWTTVDLGPDSTVGIIRRDGQLVARFPGLSLDRYLRSDAGEMLWREREAVLLAFARLALARGETGHVLRLIEQPLRDFARMKLSRPRVHLHLMGALASAHGGDAPAADHHLFEAMSLAGQSGHVRAFAEEGGMLAPLLRAHVERVPDSGMSAHLLAMLTPAEEADAAPLLTPREGDVLSQLRNGLSAKRIARSLDLTENTVKFHLKNIYGKLGVNSRTQAIVQAQALLQPIDNTLQ